jgi:hypothetical protein
VVGVDDVRADLLVAARLRRAEADPGELLFPPECCIAYARTAEAPVCSSRASPASRLAATASSSIAQRSTM